MAITNLMMSTTIDMSNYSKRIWNTRSKYGSGGKCYSLTEKEIITTRYKGRTCCGYPVHFYHYKHNENSSNYRT